MLDILIVINLWLDILLTQIKSSKYYSKQLYFSENYFRTNTFDKIPENKFTNKVKLYYKIEITNMLRMYLSKAEIMFVYRLIEFVFRPPATATLLGEVLPQPHNNISKIPFQISRRVSCAGREQFKISYRLVLNNHPGADNFLPPLGKSPYYS